MKPQRSILIVVIIILVGVGLWFFTQPKDKPEKTADVPAPAKVAEPKPLAPPSIAPPVAPPAPKPDSAPVAATTPPSDSSDPQTDLKTAFADIARLIRARDVATRYQTYTPPDEFDPKIFRQYQANQLQMHAEAAQDPHLKEIMDKSGDRDAQSYESLADQTPTLNAAGDEATYMRTVVLTESGPTIQERTDFVKINGKWYEKPAYASGGVSFGPAK